MGCDEFCVWPDGFLKLFHVVFSGLSLTGIILSTLMEDKNGYVGYELAYSKEYFFVFEFWRVTTIIACLCGFITLILWCTAFEGPRKYIVMYTVIVYYAVMTTGALMSMIFGILHLVHAGEWYSCHAQSKSCPKLSENTFFWMIVMAMISSMITFFSYFFTVIINVKYLKPPSTAIPDILERRGP